MKFSSAIVLFTALLAPTNVEASNHLNPHHCVNNDERGEKPGMTQVRRILCNI